MSMCPDAKFCEHALAAALKPVSEIVAVRTT